MREMKFRAWDKENKKMLYDFLIGSKGEVFIIKDPDLGVPEENGEWGGSVNIQD